jgi:hypothetical protein
VSDKNPHIGSSFDEWSNQFTEEMAKELELLQTKLALAVEALEFVQSQAGIADAGEACRAIIKTARAALEKIRGEK